MEEDNRPIPPGRLIRPKKIGPPQEKELARLRDKVPSEDTSLELSTEFVRLLSRLFKGK